MRTYLAICLLGILFVGHAVSSVCAYDDEVVHRRINRHAALYSNMDTFIREQLGLRLGIIDTKLLGKTIRDWIEEGGTREDANPRWLNHFHDPLEPWESAGLDMPLVPTGMSSLVWAQLSDDPGAYATNAFSWSAARANYHRALTTGSESDWAQTFQRLGQVMHLLADAAVPAHVRNDSHPSGDAYEKWAKDRAAQGLLNFQPQNPVDPVIFAGAVSNSSVPIPVSALWDQDQYTGHNPSDGPIGLAEYTNAHFYSEGTIGPSFVSGFTYPHPDKPLDTDFSIIDWSNPERVDREDGKVDQKIYLRHTGTLNPYRLLAASYWLWDCMPPQTCWGYTWLLDSEIHKEYASLLVPRAVGYCTALVDYFFRGKLDVAGMSLRRRSNGDFSGMGLKVRNASKLGQLGEMMKSGSIDLIYRYTLPGQTGFARAVVGGIYTVTGDGDPINTDFVPIEVSFPIGIPMKAKDITITLIYRGKLGNEDGAIAAKVLPLTSKIAYTGQPGCSTNPSFLYTILPDGTDDTRITDADEGRGYAWRANPTWSADGRFLAFNGITSDNRYEIVVVDLTSEEPYPGNIKRVFGDTQCHYLAPSLSPDGTKLVAQRLRMRHPPDGSDLYNALVVFDLSTGAWTFPGGIEFWRDKPYVEQPSWSPRGDQIVFQCRTQTQGSSAIYNIWSIDPQGSQLTRVTDEPYDSRWPTWSPDGEKVLFASKRDGGQTYDMWLTDRTGGNARKLVDWGVDCVSFSFSPDGERIVFQIPGGWLYIMNLDGTILEDLPATRCCGTPEWSPYVLEVFSHQIL